MNELELLHADMVKTLVKSPLAILSELTPQKVDAWHAATGIVGEAGELIDAVKKVVVYNKPGDIDNIIEELGDIEFYMEQIRQRFNIDRATTLSENMKKLEKRYPNFNYTDKSAAERADKNENSSV